MATNLSELIARTVPPLGYELVDWEMSPKGRLVRVFIDKAGGVDVEDCARVSQHLTRLFAVENVDYERLEVCSPGLDRPLKKAADYERFAGTRRRSCCARSATTHARFEGRARRDRRRAMRWSRPRPAPFAIPLDDRAGAPGPEDRVEKVTMDGGKELLLLVDALSREKNVAKDTVFPALEMALASATKKRFNDEVDVRVAIDRETGDYDAFRRWTVVPDEEHEEPAHQIAITDAAERGENLALGDVIEEPLEAGDLRPHRRAGRQAGDPAEDPRRRARADPERLPRARGEPGDRHRQAHRARQRDRRVGPHRGRACRATS